MKYLAILTSLSLVLSTPVLAVDQTSGQPAKDSPDNASGDGGKPAKPAEEKKICKLEIVTGSISKHMVCKTQSQIDAERAAGQSTIDSLQEQGRVGSSRR